MGRATRKIYGLVEQQRRDLAVNGVGRKGGAATWKTYAFEFRLPFPEIDQVRLSAGFRGGERRMIAFGLIEVGERVRRDSVRERVAAAAVAGDERRIARFGVRERQRPAAQPDISRQHGAHLRGALGQVEAALHVGELPYVEVLMSAIF